MIVFSGLNIDNTDSLDHKTFSNSVPIISNRRTVVHFVKIDTNDRNRFNFVIRVLTCDQLPSPYNTANIL